MDNINMSRGGSDEHIPEVHEFGIRMKIASCINRREFLLQCISEQVLPRSAPNQLKCSDKPFSDSARMFLEESYKQLSNRINELRDELSGAVLPNHLASELRRKSDEQKENLNRKLTWLCDNSDWKSVGREDIITNLSTRTLSNTEKEALSLGLKFDTGENKKSYVEHVAQNYKWMDDDVEKGFTQGVLACYKAMSNNKNKYLPRHYMKALKCLGNDEDIIITQADKGGGVVLLNKATYDRKMYDLLNDNTTYERVNDGYIEKESNDFERNVRKILKKTERGKKLLYLLEENPRPPRMRGLPKIHKEGIPMRPITSGIESAPHKLAKHLAKPLSKSLGSISGVHLKNSSDLTSRLRNINFKNKKIASFDVKSLFTNVPVEGAMRAIKKVVSKIKDEDLPISKPDYMKLISLCAKFNCFTFNGVEYRQHSGLAMGSPISPVAACLFMEILEVESFKEIMGSETSWYRYIDDIIVITPRRTDLQFKLQVLNNVHERIQFTLEEEKDGKLPFLDTVIWRNDQGPKFSVYRKPTNKDDFVHYLSAHTDRTKSGIIIGFFLRAIRICDQEFLQDEFEYLTQTFMKLGYPKGLILKLKNKAKIIMERNRNNNEELNSPNKFLTVPNVGQNQVISEFLEKMGIKIATASGRKIGEVVRSREVRRLSSTGAEDSLVYKIPCGGCQLAYFGETSRGLKKRIKEHRADMKYHRTSNAMVVHAENMDHLPNWDAAEVLCKGMKKQVRKAMEAAFIMLEDTTNNRAGWVTWSRTGAEIATREWSSRTLEAEHRRGTNHVT